MKDAFDISDWEEQPRRLLEKDIQGPCVKKARASGWWARKFSAAPGRTSVPDYIFARDGRVFFVEFKAPGKKPTPKQVEEHARMREAGLSVYVCDSLALFDRILSDVKVSDVEA